MSDKSQKPSKPNDHIEEKASEKETIDPSVAEKSQTDAKGKAEIDKEITNASSGSLGFDEGITAIRFEIDEGGKTVASKDVRSEKSDTDDSENDSKSITLTGVLKVIKEEGDKDQSELAQNIEVMRTQAKEKGISTEAIDEYAKEAFTRPDSTVEEDQFKRGAHKPLSPDQVENQKTLDPNDQPEGGYEQETRADGGITLKAGISNEPANNLQTIVERISELPIDKQFQIIGTGLNSFNNELERQKLEIALGTVEGIGEGFKSLGDGVVSLGNGLGQIAQFGSDVITNNPRAIETGSKAGEAIGKTLVGGVRLFQMSHDYLYDIGYTGDYAKPFNDIANLGEQLDKTWQKTPTRERAKLASKLSTEFLGGLAIPLGASKLAKSERIAQTLEEIAIKAKQLGKGAKDKTSKFIGNFVDELTQPVAVTPDGQKIRIPKEPQKAEGLHMSKPDEPNVKPSGKHFEENRKVERVDRVRLSEGFYSELGRAYDSLPESQKQFLKMKGTTVKPVKRMTDVPGGNTKQGGGYCQNTIYLPEEIMKNGFWQENDDLMFRLRHEIGHAINEESGVISGVPNSDKPSFIQAFNEDVRNASPEKFNKLKLRMDNLQIARDEVYADTYAHVTSPTKSNAAYSQLLRELFPGCYKHLSKEIKR